MDLANVSLDMSCQDLITHSTTSLLGTGFIFPAYVYSCFLFASQSYDGGFYDQSISWGLLLNLFSQQWYWRTYRSRQMFVHGNNVGIVKIELLLDSTDVHHLCYDTINHIRWILLSSCSFSSTRVPMSSHKLFTSSTTTNKQIFDGRIVVFFVKNAFGFSHDHFSNDMEHLALFLIDPVY